jgi:effector-binding domain-containing protein
MNYDITQRTMEPQCVLFMRARMEHGTLAEALAQVLPAVWGYAATRGIQLAGAPFCRYLSWGPGMFTIEAGLPVARGSVGEAAQEIEVGELPGGIAAATVHEGSYDGLADAHAALEVYLHDNGLRSSSPPYEVYLTDPGEVPEPSDWRTLVVWPL